jgi:RNA polymerase sigma-70 factor (ECF subfamily)
VSAPELADVPDRELLTRHAGGDPDAFAEIVRRHRDRIWTIALRMLGDREEAADAAQDALLSALRAAAGFRGDAAVSTWLHRITVNACLDRLRRRRVTVPLDEATTPLPSRIVMVPSATDRVPAALDVAAALARLPSDAREVLLLVDMEDRPLAEVAVTLGIPVGTVKSRCSRARARLALLLGQFAPEGNPAAAPRVGDSGGAG